jgi:hypothetical protein
MDEMQFLANRKNVGSTILASGECFTGVVQFQHIITPNQFCEFTLGLCSPGQIDFSRITNVCQNRDVYLQLHVLIR